MCPVHTLAPYYMSLGVGSKPYDGITGAQMLETLRTALEDRDVADARQYRCHDLRRGHADDLRKSGASLSTILQAGEWRSPAFLRRGQIMTVLCIIGHVLYVYFRYLNEEDLEADAILEAHLDESDEASLVSTS